MRCRFLAVVLVTLLASAAAQAARPQIETQPDGALQLHARDTTRGEVLQAMANEIGFEAVIAGGAAARRLASLTVAAPSLEDAIHEVLRGCNYALFYGDGDQLYRVVVLPQASPGRAVRAAPPPRRRPGRKGAAPRGPTVIRQ